MKVWELGEAAVHLEEIIEEVQTCGVQFITKNGSEEAAVVSMAEYRLLTRSQSPMTPRVSD